MDRDEKFLLALLREYGVTYRSVPPPVSRLLFSCIGTVAALWIGVIPLIWILERRLHGDPGKKNRTAARQMVSFDDVQGVDSAKQELIEVIFFAILPIPIPLTFNLIITLQKYFIQFLI
jgi:ATP-dependent Zn protease